MKQNHNQTTAPCQLDLGRGHTVLLCQRSAAIVAGLPYAPRLKKVREGWMPYVSILDVWNGGTEERPLHHVIAEKVGLHLAEFGQRYAFKDGNRLNMAVDNITIVTVTKAEEPETVKERTPVERAEDYPSAERQVHWLLVCRPQIRNVIHSILREPTLANEIFGQVTLELLEAIHLKQCDFKHFPRFRGLKYWAKSIARIQALKRLEGVLCKYIGSIEPDRSEIRLRQTLLSQQQKHRLPKKKVAAAY